MAPDNIFTLENCIEPPWYGCQPRNFIVFKRLSLIVRVNEVLNRTVVVDMQ